jgi:hypothetical protein
LTAILHISADRGRRLKLIVDAGTAIPVSGTPPASVWHAVRLLAPTQEVDIAAHGPLVYSPERYAEFVSKLSRDSAKLLSVCATHSNYWLRSTCACWKQMEIHMEILVLSFVAGLVVVGGLWLASRDTKPIGHDDLGLLADSAKLSADRASAAVDEALAFVRGSNLRIDTMENSAR